tara:strand:- start:5575 stop:6042 length:468 start_codon:yes stop_codon:yes gene_type:complete
MNQIALVKARHDHSEIIWTWRNDPMTRKMSINEEKVSWEQHSSWYKKVLLDKNRKLYVGELKDIPVGMVRFDKSDNEEFIYEVSITIAPYFRGKGFGKKLLMISLEKLLDEVKECKLFRAEIKKNNESSKNIFKSCGFVSSECKSQIYTYELSLL